MSRLAKFARFDTPRGFAPDDVPFAEFIALRSFYKATNGPNWTTNTNWLSDRTVGNWYGITVSGGHVTQISLSSNALNGNASTHLDSLTNNLTSLDLSGNTNLSSIDVANLTSLNDLNLNDCGFGQSLVDQILQDMDATEVTGGTLNLGGSNSAPSKDGNLAKYNLEDDSWTVTVSTVTLVNTGTFRIATADGAAAIYAGNLDLSGYTSNFIEIQDSSGNQAWAYGYQADGAESTTELMTNGDNESAMASFNQDNNVRCTATQDNGQAHGGTFSTKLTQNAGELNGFRREFVDAGGSLVTFGKLYKGNAWAYTPSGQGGTGSQLGSWDGLGVNLLDTPSNITDSWVNYSGYFTPISYFRIQIQAPDNSYNDGDTQYWDDISIAEVAALGTTALQLRNTAGGSTKNLIGKDAGFDPNDIVRVEVYNE